ncbi:MAG TPA: DUF5615 family PIN-like protein [Xanthomonadales bacterium]|nr:DUF5615 family PIN-like protein [Xanthomonadales bacterium]
MPKKPHKYKILLDENMPPRSRLPRLNNRFDVKHIREDFKRVELSDPEVYVEALKLKRISVTLNEKDFYPLAGTKNDRGIIGLSPNLSYEQMDKKLTSLLIKYKPGFLKRKLTTVSGETKV